MIRSVRVAGAQLPRPVAEDGNEKEEEDTGDFQKQDAAETLEWAQESAYAARRIGSGASGLARLVVRGRRSSSGAANARYCHGGIRAGLTSDSLPGEASRNAEPNAQNPANSLRSCHVYDGSSVRKNLGKQDCFLCVIHLRWSHPKQPAAHLKGVALASEWLAAPGGNQT